MYECIYISIVCTIFGNMSHYIDVHSCTCAHILTLGTSHFVGQKRKEKQKHKNSWCLSWVLQFSVKAMCIHIIFKQVLATSAYGIFLDTSPTICCTITSWGTPIVYTWWPSVCKTPLMNSLLRLFSGSTSSKLVLHLPCPLVSHAFARNKHTNLATTFHSQVQNSDKIKMANLLRVW